MELYGKYKAKLSDELWNRIKDRPDGKLVLVTAINNSGRRGKDNYQHWTYTGIKQDWQEGNCCTA